MVYLLMLTALSLGAEGIQNAWSSSKIKEATLKPTFIKKPTLKKEKPPGYFIRIL